MPKDQNWLKFYSQLCWSVFSFYRFLVVFPLACKRGLVPCLSSESFSGSGWSGSSPMALGATTGDKLVSFQTEIWVHMTWASSCPPQSSPAAPYTAEWECPLCRGPAHVQGMFYTKQCPLSLSPSQTHTYTQNKTAPSHRGQNVVCAPHVAI